jgi:hypothetical protein
MPWEVPSDLNVEEESPEALFGRWCILVDLCGEFQGAAGVCTGAALLVPALLVSGVYFDWFAEDRRVLALVGAAVLFVVLATLAVHSWLWFIWIRRRERRVFGLMHPEVSQKL